MGWSISAKNLEHEQQVQASVIQKRPTSQILGHQSQEFSHHKGVSTPRQFGGTKRLQNPKNSRCRKLIFCIYLWPFQASFFPAGPTSVDTWSTLGFPTQPFFFQPLGVNILTLQKRWCWLLEDQILTLNALVLVTEYHLCHLLESSASSMFFLFRKQPFSKVRCGVGARCQRERRKDTFRNSRCKANTYVYNINTSLG